MANVSPSVKNDIESLRKLPAKTAAELDELIVQMDVFRSEMLSFMKDYDVILCPVNAYAALPHGTQSDSEHGPGSTYVSAYSITGRPPSCASAKPQMACLSACR